MGATIVWEACAAPFKKILTNAGYSNDDIYGIISKLSDKEWMGYDLKNETFRDMKEAGILDPAKVTRCALENAASVAGTILLTECTIVDKPEEKKSNEGFGDAGGMY
jgi:chaperonin GroEL